MVEKLQHVSGRVWLDFALAKRLLAERHSWYVDAHSPPRGPGSET